MFANLVFRQLFDASSSTYTYLLGDPRTRHAVIIDTVFEQHLRDYALVGELNLKLIAAVDTHCHADHVTGARMMQQATGCRIGISRRYQPPVEGADLPLDHGDRITFGSRHLDVRATPGHTDGCVTLVLEDRSIALTGDALLIGGAGRCDFQTGNAHTLYRSIVQQMPNCDCPRPIFQTRADLSAACGRISYAFCVIAVSFRPRQDPLNQFMPKLIALTIT